MVLQNVWVTEVTGWPVYTPCSECHTKIDPESGECKKKSTGCASTPASEVKVLATLNLSDPTGCVEKVLADEEALCVMTNIKLEEKAKLVKMLERHGVQFLCFRQPVDVRLGTAPYMTKSRRDKGAALGTQDTETQTVFAAESQFQVLAAKPCFAVGFKDDERPSLRKILSRTAAAGELCLSHQVRLPRCELLQLGHHRQRCPNSSELCQHCGKGLERTDTPADWTGRKPACLDGA